MRCIDLHNDWQPRWADAIHHGYRFPPYWWLRSVSPQSRRQLMQQELDNHAADGDAMLAGVLDKKGELTGFAAAQRLMWDSDHFDLEVWRLTHLGVWGSAPAQREAACALCEWIVQQARRRGADTIHTWIPLDDLPVIHVLEDSGFRVMESQVLWLFDLTRQPLPPRRTTAVVRPHRSQDQEAIIDLARRVYTPIPDRFHADPHLPQAACNELYAAWMRNACRGEAADFVAVVEIDGVLAGYGSLRYAGDREGLCNVRIAQFLLGALEPAFRRSGAYDDMMTGMLEWLQFQGADAAYVGTQTNNIAAQAGMARQGWRPVRGGLSLHLWLGKERYAHKAG